MSIIKKDKYKNKPTEKSSVVPSEVSASSQRNYAQSTGFVNYFSEDKLQSLIDRKIGYKGILQVMPSGYRHGYVETAHGVIVLPETVNLNRALHGDEVVVMLIETSSDETKLVDWQINDTKSDTTIIKTRLIGSVVGVTKQNNLDKVYECLPAQNQRKQGLLLQPIDQKYPQIEVHNSFTKQPPNNQIFEVKLDMWLQQMALPSGEIVREGKLIELKELDQICDFTLTSVGIPYNYKAKEPLKPEIQQLIDENERSLCTDCALDRKHVFELCQENLLDIKSLCEHLKQRQDVFDGQHRELFVDKMVFTIDPDTAKDFDDSCHVDLLINGKVVSFYELQQMPEIDRFKAMEKVQGYEIGVHIADVTHYVESQKELDQVALSSTTSVYLTDRCCPMYPYALADGLCSLNPAVPRYTYSVVFRLDKNCELIKQKVRFTKGLIVSYARLDYVAAQAMIDKTISEKDCQETTFFERWPCAKGYHQAVIRCVQTMNEIALKLRKQRESLGALQIKSDQLRWRVDAKMNVQMLQPENAGLAHHLIEEFMVIANSLVAMRLVCSFPAAPVLRQHSPPKSEFEYQRALEELKLGKLDLGNGFRLCQSLDKIAAQFMKSFKIKETGQLTAEQYSQASVNAFYMSNGLIRAKYIAGMSNQDGQMSHWGIHSQLYMHFTSPIRRYADDICHRMLTASLMLEKEIPDFAIYRNSEEYAYLPHELVIQETKSIYSMQQLPPMDFRKLCDKLYPLNDQMDAEIQQKGKKVGNVVDQLIGKDNHVDLKSEKVKQRLFKAIDKVIEGGMEELEETDNFYDKEEINKNSLAYVILDQCQQNLDKLMGTSIDLLRLQLNKCNELAIAADSAETLHHQMMLYHLIKNQKPENQKAEQRFFINSQAILISCKKGLLFFIPEFDISFNIPGDAVEDSGSMFSIEMHTDQPLNKQTPQGEVTTKQFQILKPYPVKITYGQEVVDGIEIWMQ